MQIIIKPYLPNEAATQYENLLKKLSPPQQEPFQTANLHDLSIAIFGNSPYLSGLIERHPQLVIDFYELGIEECVKQVFNELETPSTSRDMLMQKLRLAKQKIALLVAMADISLQWNVAQVTLALSNFAALCLQQTLQYLTKIAIETHALAPETSGIFILGLGKLGAQTLNYSSDIDIIIFYDADKLAYQGKQSAQNFMSKLAQDLTSIMQERTRDGYVFRTDLRLRPDPASTPPAVTTRAAIMYYETVGQNWERAALIKANLVAGDGATAQEFMQAIAPFIWRKHLDFAAISDILSIKRQMRGHSEDETLNIFGHNIKTGRGGIREIEFFAQIHQLIWGGRHPELRLRNTVDTLEMLAQTKMTAAEDIEALIDSYYFLRHIEHRLQMIADAQTHTIPQTEAELEHLSIFAGFPDAESFRKKLLYHLKRVNKLYAAAFWQSAPLGGSGSLVFTGVDHDPETLNTLRTMGFIEVERISSAVQDWHKGHRRCTRTPRSRALLTELVPDLLQALSQTIHPDTAFAQFDQFMQHLPAGIQIFSLFTSRPELLKLIAEIMGSAPAMGALLSSNPHLLDAVITGGFYEPLANESALQKELNELLEHAHDEEDALNILHSFRNEKQFQAGIQLLKKMATPAEIGFFLSQLAQIILQQVRDIMTRSFENIYGKINGDLAIIMIGRLGSQEMTFHSDMDLIFVYHLEDENQMSGGEKPLSPSAWFNRLAQRIVGALTAKTKHGSLYPVDTRLRPFGKDGALAVSFAAYQKYLSDSAWTFEFLALTRARITCQNSNFTENLQQLLRKQLNRPRSPARIAAAIHDMRERLAKSQPPKNDWDLKHITGGLMDMDFIWQYWVMINYGKCPEIMGQGSEASFAILANKQLIDPEILFQLRQARRLFYDLLSFLRLCNNGYLEETNASEGLKHTLADAMGKVDFMQLKTEMQAAREKVVKLVEGL